MQRLRQNLSFKILALGCAFALFLYVRKQQATESPEFLLPLELAAPPGLKVVEPKTPRQVRVRLVGPSEAIRALDDSQIKAGVDLVGRRKGIYHNLPVNVALPADVQDRVQLAYYAPTRLTVRLDEFVERQVQVEPVLRAQPPAGHNLDLPRVEPSTVTISGLGQSVERVKAAHAVITEINSTDRLDQIVRVSALDERGDEVGEGLQIRPTTVRVRARIERSIWSKTLYVDPDLGPLPPGMRLRRLRVTPDRVTVTGSDAAIGGLWVVRTRRLPLSVQTTRVDQSVLLEVPPGARSVSPSTVRVEIELEGVSA